MQILKFMLHGAQTIPNWVLIILPKFEIIWLTTDTAQTIWSLYGNYYGKSYLFVQCLLAFSHIFLTKSSIAVLIGNVLSYNFAEDHFMIKCMEQKLWMIQVTSVLWLWSTNCSAGIIGVSGAWNRAQKSWLLCFTAQHSVANKTAAWSCHKIINLLNI